MNVSSGKSILNFSSTANGTFIAAGESAPAQTMGCYCQLFPALVREQSALLTQASVSMFSESTSPPMTLSKRPLEALQCLIACLV